MADPYIGEIRMMGFSFAPRDWSFCSGAVLAISSQQTLFALLGTFYGGDGRTTFALPNLVSRCPVGFNMGTPLGALTPYPIGTYTGNDSVTLTQAHMPAHSHLATFTPTGGSSNISVTVEATTDDGDAATPSAGAMLSKSKATGGSADKDENIYNSTPTAGSLVPLGGVTVSGSSTGGGTVDVGVTGSNVAIDVTNPLVAINFSIAMTGVFPPRN